MSKCTKPSFVHELSFRVYPRDATVLSKRLEEARQLYNACLSHWVAQLVLSGQPHQKAKHPIHKRVITQNIRRNLYQKDGTIVIVAQDVNENRLDTSQSL